MMNGNDGATGRWQRLSRETLYDLPGLRLHRDRVTQPDGATGDFRVLDIPDCALTVAVDEAERIALVRYGTYLHGEMLTPPGGRVEPGESPEAAARRELAEEAGITAASWHKLGTVALMTNSTSRLHMFLATGLTLGEQQLSGTEAGMKLEWWELPDAVRAALDGRMRLSGAALSVLMYAHRATGGSV
ncbi:NUDIX domain-containing protein [Streptomyces orinoci]|uniref:NUDIX hydrolase n=1 Tax=Streptomyces orinoci TaxID=67339 RepID=A0ABV3K8J5_STRON|nr:NUDIX hydrolase [Streptomyces orinoci]